MGIVEVVQMYQLVRLSPNRKGRLAHCAPLAFPIEKNHLLCRMRPFVPLRTNGPLSQWCYLINGQWPREPRSWLGDTDTTGPRHCDTGKLRHWHYRTTRSELPANRRTGGRQVRASRCWYWKHPRHFLQFFKTSRTIGSIFLF